jgi:hypothetical protein
VEEEKRWCVRRGAGIESGTGESSISEGVCSGVSACDNGGGAAVAAGAAKGDRGPRGRLVVEREAGEGAAEAALPRTTEPNARWTLIRHEGSIADKG